jgi:hypothetical protein
VDGGGVVEAGDACRLEAHPAAAAVAIIGGSGDEAVRAHAVDQAGEAALAEEDAGGELRHAQAVALGFLELDKDVIPWEGEGLFGLQFGFEHADDAGVCLEECPPRFHVDAANHRCIF